MESSRERKLKLQGSKELSEHREKEGRGHSTPTRHGLLWFLQGSIDVFRAQSSNLVVEKAFPDKLGIKAFHSFRVNFSSIWIILNA